MSKYERVEILLGLSFVNAVIQPSPVSCAVLLAASALLALLVWCEPKPVPREEIDKLADEVKAVKNQIGVLKMTFGMDGGRVSMFSQNK